MTAELLVNCPKHNSSDTNWTNGCAYMKEEPKDQTFNLRTFSYLPIDLFFNHIKKEWNRHHASCRLILHRSKNILGKKRVYVGDGTTAIKCTQKTAHQFEKMAQGKNGYSSLTLAYINYIHQGIHFKSKILKTRHHTFGCSRCARCVGQNCKFIPLTLPYINDASARFEFTIALIAPG